MKNNAQETKSNKELYIIISIIVLNFVSLFLASFYDKFSQIVIWGNNPSFIDLKYWLWFFTWWSAWTSLMSLLWGFWKLIFLKKKSTFFSQIADLIVLQSNVVSGGIFCFGGFLFTLPRKKYILVETFSSIKISNLQFWIFYNFIWHFLAPIIFCYYFYKYSKVGIIRKRKKKSLFSSMANPFFYLFYVFARPIIANMPKKGSANSPQSYPRDYPYSFFFLCIGEDISKAKPNGNGKRFLDGLTKTGKSVFWSFVIFSSIYLMSFLIFSLAIRKKEKKNKINLLK